MQIKKDPTCVTLTFCPASYWLRKCNDEFHEDYMLTNRIDMSYSGKGDQEGTPVLYLTEDEAQVFKDAGFSEIV